ncbi:MAG TPA: response regulator transcription factor [Gemmatimonadaceae bacterium]|nr:response regulator transcription factor [Gemmatimonadaceae bacterium]
MTTDVIRVLLADDHRVVRAGLRAVLGIARDISVVGEASNGKEAVAMAAELQPDVVVMDLAMPELDGISATKEIIAAKHAAKVLVLSMHAEQEHLVPVMEAGASGYVLKTEADRELVNAIRAVAHGDVYLRPAASRVLARRLVPRETEHSDQDRYARLTDRERAVLRLVGQGYSAPEIGNRLFISPKTVDTYKQRIQEKLGLAHRSQYVQFAFRLGLLAAE